MTQRPAQQTGMSVHSGLDDRDDRYIYWCISRASNRSDTAVANKYGLTPKALWQQLANDGFRVCPECGKHRPEKGHWLEHVSRKRLPRGTDAEAQELPPAKNGGDLFGPAVALLERDIAQLPFLRQWFKDGRFVTEIVYDEDSGLANHLYSRDHYEELGEDAWREDCERHGVDPNVGEFRVPYTEVLERGAEWFPDDILVRLLTARALSGLPLEPLLERLHPEPNKEDSAEVARKLQELLLRARQLAALIRGNRGATRKGEKPPQVPPKEHANSRQLADQSKRGLSDAALTLSVRKLARSKRKRIRDLQLPRTEVDLD